MSAAEIKGLREQLKEHERSVREGAEGRGGGGWGGAARRGSAVAGVHVTDGGGWEPIAAAWEEHARHLCSRRRRSSGRRFSR
jgi:hypothetical protein